MTGTLYGIGVGPGDPELLTLKAARLLGTLRVIAYPAPRTGSALAREIVCDLLQPDVVELAYPLPMRRDREAGQRAYDWCAGAVRRHLSAGRDVGVLCEGDPLFYGSFMYLADRLTSDARIEVVPGVTSVSAASAAARLPLVARNGTVQILPAPLDDATLRERLQRAETTVLMKIGTHMSRVRDLIDRLGLAPRSTYIAHASGPGEVVLPLSEAPGAAPYFSMIVVRREVDPWLH